MPPFKCCPTQYFYQFIDPFSISHILAHEASLLTCHQGNRNTYEFFFVPSDFLLDSHATHCSLFSLMLCLLETPLCRSSFFFTLKGNAFPLFLVKTTCHMKSVPVLLHEGPPLLAGEGLQPSQLPPAGPPVHDPGLRPELAEENEEKSKEV